MNHGKATRPPSQTPCKGVTLVFPEIVLWQRQSAREIRTPTKLAKSSFCIFLRKRRLTTFGGFGPFPFFFPGLSCQFRCNVSQAIADRTSSAALPSLARVHLRHMNRNISVSCESQREIALLWALSRGIPDYQHGEVGKINDSLFRKVLVFDVSRAVRIARFESVSDSQLHDPRPASRDTWPLSSSENRQKTEFSGPQKRYFW